MTAHACNYTHTHANAHTIQAHIHTQVHPFFKMANYCCFKKSTSNTGKLGSPSTQAQQALPTFMNTTLLEVQGWQ
jgi:hypothetical protein